MVDPHSEYIPAPQVWARYKVAPVTGWRWERNPELKFPAPIIINRRKFFRREEIEAWERSRARRAAPEKAVA